MSKQRFLNGIWLVVVASLLATCGPTPEPQVVEKTVRETVRETVIVEGTPQIIEKEVTRIVQETVEVPVEATVRPTEGKSTLTFSTGMMCTTLLSYESQPCNAQTAQLFDGLTFLAADGAVEPALATSWEMLDQKTWEFQLRKGVKFHNGEDFTAESVKYTFGLMLDPQETFAAESKKNLERIVDVEVVDDYTVRFHVSANFADLPFFFGQAYLLPPGYGEQVGIEGMQAEPVGTGPFKFVEFVSQDYARFEAFDDYWGGRPKIDEVVWRVIFEAATRLASLQAGETDIIAQVPLDLVSLIEADPNLSLVAVEQPTVLQIFFDVLPANGSPCLDLRVRQAIDYAIDKETIWKELLHGMGRVSGQNLTPGVFGYNPDIKHTPYDPQKAKDLLAEAGYPDGLGGLSLFCPTGKYAIDRDACIAIGDQLAQVGIDVMVRTDSNLWNEIFDARDRRADMIYVGWYSMGNPAQAMQWYTKGNPWGRWENDDYDQLFDIARTDLDEGVREEAWYRMAEILTEDTPTVFLFQQPLLYALSKRVKNWTPHQMEYLILNETQLQD